MNKTLPESGTAIEADKPAKLYGDEFREELPDDAEGKRISVRVSGHWLTGEITSTNEQSYRETDLTRFSVSVHLDSREREQLSDLKGRRLILVTSTYDSYDTNESGWKTVDASIGSKAKGEVTQTLLGILGDVKTNTD